MAAVLTLHVGLYAEAAHDASLNHNFHILLLEYTMLLHLLAGNLKAATTLV